MKYFSIIAVCAVIAFWVFKKYESDNQYYDNVAPDRSNMSIAERALLALEREHDLELRKEETVLRKYKNGELSQDQYNEYLKKKAEQDRSEQQQVVEDLGNMFDPDKGMFSGVIKMGSKPQFKKQKQIDKLERDIQKTLSLLENDQTNVIKIKLRGIKWIPIDNKVIDEKMTKFYKNKISTLINEIDNNY